jgi:6-pyruvoyltetrahydropterin/6-carboxytetrahydropterin synthase
MPRLASVTCEFTFESSHRLRREDWSAERNEEVFGDCARLHGHSYRLLVTVRGAISAETGMVVNFRDLKHIVRERVIGRLDHQHLDEVVGGLTTAENLCYWIATQLVPEFGASLQRVELWETRTACAVLDNAEILQLLEAHRPPLLA